MNINTINLKSQSKPQGKPDTAALLKQLEVVETKSVSENMQKVVLSIDDIDMFPQECAGYFIKLLFTPQGDTDLAKLKEDEKRVMRTLTISEFDRENKQLSIEFVKHSSDGSHAPESTDLTLEEKLKTQGGYACHWAMTAKKGDKITVRGPRPIEPFSVENAHYLLVADLTSLTAIRAQLSRLPSDAKGYLVLELNSILDKPDFTLPDLQLPENMQLEICIQGEGQSLSQKVESLPWPSSTPSIWCACEFSDMRAIRSYVSAKAEFERKSSYFSSYWKQGITEEGHKLVKREDAANLQKDS